MLTDFLTTGTYTAKREFFKTTSPSMDILVSSNLERLLYHVTGSDAEVAGFMQQLAATGSYTVRPETLAAIQQTFSCGWSSEEMCIRDSSLGGVILQRTAEAQRGLIGAAQDILVQTVKGTAADEQDVGGVDLDELLLRVLAAALRRHVADSSLQDLQQCLLYALAAHIASDGGVFALAGDLVDLRCV